MSSASSTSSKRQRTSESKSGDGADLLDLLMVGTGEYTTGFVHDGASDSDKSAGVVALTLMDMRRRGKVGRLAMCGTNGAKMPRIRAHMQKSIGDVYNDMDLSFDAFPKGEVRDPEAYVEALKTFKRGDAVTIFTPDDTHFKIALACVKAGLHVLVTKPIVKTLPEHLELLEAARKENVLVMVEVHKRFDPIYVDARDRIKGLGPFSFFDAFMSQPKHQLDTFRHWAGKSSDISYYLNSHHVDFLDWALQGAGQRPVSVTAFKATGVAKSKGIETEDTITLTAQIEHLETGALGVAIFTSSWVAPKSDVHSQQRFFYMGQAGQVNVDQAHRGYNMSADGSGYASCNPLFMKYTPSPSGDFSGQLGYGYRSFEAFVDAVRDINAGKATPASFDASLPTAAATVLGTAILEAGRVSLDAGGAPVRIEYGDKADPCAPTGLKVAATAVDA